MPTKVIQDKFTDLAARKDYTVHTVAEQGQYVFILEKTNKEQNVIHTIVFVFWSEELEDNKPIFHSIDEVMKCNYYSHKSYVRMKLIDNLIHDKNDLEAMNEVYSTAIKVQNELEKFVKIK